MLELQRKGLHLHLQNLSGKVGMRRGFTLVELLVTFFIVSVALTIAYVAYINIVKGFKKQSKLTETQIEAEVGIELMRLDIEHIGYGIGEDQDALPLEQLTVASGDPLYPNKLQLVLRSVMNNTNQATVGWALVDCSGGFLQVAGDSINNGTSVVYLGAGNRIFVANGSFGVCPGSGFYVAFPYDDTVASGCGTDPGDQYCNEISYILSANQNLATCHPGTRNLLRRVGAGAGFPLLNCVADWLVTYDIDRNGDGAVDVYDGEFNSATTSNDLDLNDDGVVSADEVRIGLKKVNVYILVQEGRRDPDYTFRNAVACATSSSGMAVASGACVRIDTGAGTADLGLPVDFANYRWKVIKLFVKPLNL